MKAKLISAAVMSMVVFKSFALVGDSKPLKAIPSDTVSATIKVCNFYSSPVLWTFKSIGKETIVVAGTQYLEQNTCSLVGLRKPLDSTTSVQVNVVSSEQTPAVNASFVLGGISQEKGYFDQSLLTKYMTATAFQNADLINTYSSNGWTTVPLATNPKMKNLSGGVAPDFVLCVGGNSSQCNDSFGNQ